MSNYIDCTCTVSTEQTTTTRRGGDGGGQFIVIGGGIAGVCCAETLVSLCPDRKVILISASPLVKAVTNYKKISETLEEFDVEERPSSTLEQSHPNISVLCDAVDSLDACNKCVITSSGQRLHYNKLCVCTGARPNLICKNNSYVIGLRDTESVQQLQDTLKSARRVVVVGNGGIAMELVYEIASCEVIWVIKHTSIGHAFFDEGVAQFLLPSVNNKTSASEPHAPMKRLTYTVDSKTVKEGGSALGPDWCTTLPLTGSNQNRSVHVVYQCEVKEVLSQDEWVTNTSDPHADQSHIPNTESGCDKISTWPVYVQLTNGETYGCDLVVSATGVTPNVETLLKHTKFQCDSTDGSLVVNRHMLTSVSDIYSAGDVCRTVWSEHSPLHWFQMKLWTQARQMGCYAARCMVAHSHDETIDLDFCFEMFTHVTRFFGFKVILLGAYNGQGLAAGYKIDIRCIPGLEYVKIVLSEGKMQGAILIGETDLEETFENLILNQLDLTGLEDDLLDPGIDIEAYFD